MTNSLRKAKEELGPKWVELSESVRHYAAASLENPGDEQALKELAAEALTLCEHVDRLHSDLGDLLESLENAEGTSKGDGPDEREIDMAAVETQRETHEMSSNPIDVLKALLMWRDDPAERVK